MADPDYTYCEPMGAGSISPWCIRPLGPKGVKLSGGIDTTSLCGRVNPEDGGWDMNYRFERKRLVRHVCRMCEKIWNENVGK